MFKNVFSFEGRIRRTEYGISFIIYFIARVIIIFAIAYPMIANGANSDVAGGVAFIASIPPLWFLLAQGAKRCHDIGKSGWWQLIPFFPLWLIFKEGEPGSNQYGENPKNIQVMSGQMQQRNSNPQINTGLGYQGGYSGGHNNPTTNYNQTGQESQRDGYKDGNLYN